MAKEINIHGKEYFDVKEAAHFACVSERQFRAKARFYGIAPIDFMGKNVYRRADIRQAIESQAL